MKNRCEKVFKTAFKTAAGRKKQSGKAAGDSSGKLCEKVISPLHSAEKTTVKINADKKHPKQPKK